MSRPKFPKAMIEKYSATARAALKPRRLDLEQKRFRGKINIQKPQKLFYERALVTEFVTPFYPNTAKPVPLWEVCTKATNVDKIVEPPHPYMRIIARELFERFDRSKMIAFLHKNSINQDEEFELAVELKKKGDMMLKSYGQKTVAVALEGTKYENVLPLFDSKGYIVFSPEPNTEVLRKIVNKTPQVTILAGILHDQLLNVNDFLKYGKMDITEAQSRLVHTLQTAGGINLSRQLSHHQTTLVSRLQQIGKNDGEGNEGGSQEAKSDENAKPE